MPAEVNLRFGSKPPESEKPFFPEQKSRLREIYPGSDLLFRPVRHLFFENAHGGRIAGIRPVGKSMNGVYPHRAANSDAARWPGRRLRAEIASFMPESVRGNMLSS